MSPLQAPAESKRGAFLQAEKEGSWHLFQGDASARVVILCGGVHDTLGSGKGID